MANFKLFDFFFNEIINNCDKIVEDKYSRVYWNLYLDKYSRMYWNLYLD